jgi:RNA-directed DNA polymerase
VGEKKVQKACPTQKRAEHLIGRIAKQNPKLFNHWELGINLAAK